MFDYGTTRFANYTEHDRSDESVCAPFWMELHDHKYDTEVKSWKLIPIAIHREDVSIVVYDKCFKIIIPVVGELIEFNHKLLHGLLPLEIAKHLEGKKRKTKGYLDWENDYINFILNKDNRSSYPVMEWRFV